MVKCYIWEIRDNGVPFKIYESENEEEFIQKADECLANKGKSYEFRIKRKKDEKKI